MPQQKYHHGDLKNALVQAALDVLNRDGAEALSLRSVAAAAGVSHMAPYSHFKNKKELLQAVAAAGFRQLTDTMLQQKDAQGEDNLVLCYGTVYVEFALANPQLYRLMMGQVEPAGKRQSAEEIGVAIAQASPSSDLEESARLCFTLLRDAFALRLNDPQLITAQAVGAWSLVHGMAALLIEGHISIPDSMSVKNFLAKAVIVTQGVNPV